MIESLESELLREQDRVASRLTPATAAGVTANRLMSARRAVSRPQIVWGEGEIVGCESAAKAFFKTGNSVSARADPRSTDRHRWAAPAAMDEVLGARQ